MPQYICTHQNSTLKLNALKLGLRVNQQIKSLRSSLCRTFLRQTTVVSLFFMTSSPFFFYGTGLKMKLKAVCRKKIKKHGYQAISIVDGQSWMIYKVLVFIMLKHSLQRCFSYNG